MTIFHKYRFWALMMMLAVFPVWMTAQNESFQFDSFCPSAPIVKDHEGNTYRTVQIGSQCWMAENMRCTSSPSGARWYYNPSFTAAQPEFAAYYASPANPRHGFLYNWAAAMDLTTHQTSNKPVMHPFRGICPSGWHLPRNGLRCHPRRRLYRKRLSIRRLPDLFLERRQLQPQPSLVLHYLRLQKRMLQLSGL